MGYIFDQIAPYKKYKLIILSNKKGRLIRPLDNTKILNKII